MISCIAIDDEPLALEIIESYCKRHPALRLLKTFTDTSEASRFLRKFPVDLLFLDIQMPDQNGIEFYRENGEGKMVIFTTAYSEYAVEGFNVSAVDYLLKPVEHSRFIHAVDKAVEYFNYTHSSGNQDLRFLFVRSEYSLVKIPFSQIEYIETLDDYLKIHQAGKKPTLTKMNLKNIMSRLDPREFIRVHRSYIVPLSKIVSVRNKIIRLAETEIPIGAKFEEEFFSNYSGR
jgi:DNA-binding LytR/AlgR family response regulator